MTNLGQQSHQIQLDIAGILRLLSENLYADQRIVIRELLQNAHDSCHRRLIEDGSMRDYAPAISISLHPEQRLLSIHDNGSGLTRGEIHHYLSTVGASYTRELAQKQPDERLIGQFGLGLLSAFIVSEKVELITRSYQSGHPALKWTSTGEETYVIEPAARSEVGTTVNLYLKLDGEYLLNDHLLKSIVRRYADLLPIPILLNGADQLNAMDAPWHKNDVSKKGYVEYLDKRYGIPEPLTIIPLSNHVTGTKDTKGRVIALRGFLYIPSVSILSVQEFGDATVYINRMFVTEEERDILPRWARFVKGIIESPELTPTASREQIKKDDGYYRVNYALEQQLLEHFNMLAQEEPQVWRNIVIEHNDLIKGWALESPRFFEAVCDIVTFNTSRGRLTLPEFLSLSDNILYYFVDDVGATQEKMLYEAAGLPVIDASSYAEEEFLHAYSKRSTKISLKQLEPGSQYLFDPVPDELDDWEYIIRYFSEQGINVEMVSFNPTTIPAVLLFPPGSDQIAKTRKLVEDGDLSQPLSGLFEEYLRIRGAKDGDLKGTLHINVENSLIKKIRDLSPDNVAFTALLELIYYNARFFSGQALTAHDARLSYDMITYSAEQLIHIIQSSE